MVVKKKKKKKKEDYSDERVIPYIILLLQKSGLERKKSLKLKSTQISISSRGKSFSISCLVASLLSKFPRKPIFPFILKETNPLVFFFFFFFGGGGLQSSKIYFTINTYWMPWCAPFFDHHRHSEPSFQTIWFCPFFHPREIVKANHLFLLTIENVCVMKTKYKPIEMQPTSL